MTLRIQVFSAEALGRLSCPGQPELIMGKSQMMLFIPIFMEKENQHSRNSFYKNQQ